jgi:hypothetical protein
MVLREDTGDSLLSVYQVGKILKIRFLSNSMPAKRKKKIKNFCLLCRGLYDQAEADWDQKASAAFHTKNSLKFLKSLFNTHKYRYKNHMTSKNKVEALFPAQQGCHSQ